jgi:hypothetical protein
MRRRVVDGAGKGGLVHAVLRLLGPTGKELRGEEKRRAEEKKGGKGNNGWNSKQRSWDLEKRHCSSRKREKGRVLRASAGRI